MCLLPADTSQNSTLLAAYGAVRWRRRDVTRVQILLWDPSDKTQRRSPSGPESRRGTARVRQRLARLWGRRSAGIYGREMGSFPTASWSEKSLLAEGL